MPRSLFGFHTGPQAAYEPPPGLIRQGAIIPSDLEITMAGPTPIACDLHDYIEIACMRGYEVRIILDNDSEIVGQAKTTRTSADKLEYLIVDVDDLLVDVPTHEIVSMTALAADASFAQINFK